MENYPIELAVAFGVLIVGIAMAWFSFRDDDDDTDIYRLHEGDK